MALTDDLKKLVMDVTREGEGPYISIFMTIHPNDTNLQLDKVQYKKLVAQAQKDFIAAYPKREWPAYQEEFDMVGLERKIGRNGYQGLAVIASKTHVFKYYLTLAPEDQSYVSKNLYILPIIKNAQYNFDYDLVHLNKAGFSFYQVRRGLIKAVDLPAEAPTNFEKTISDPAFSAAEAQAAEHSGNAVYSGPAAPTPRSNDHVAHYLRVVDQYIRQKFTLLDHVPLVLVGSDEIQDQFRSISKNGMLEADIRTTKVAAKLDQAALNQLKQLINDQFKAQVKARVLQELDNARSGGREISGVDNVVQAAIEGRIRQVIIRENTVEHGVIDLDMNVDTKSPKAAAHNLLNDIAVVTLAFGGQVQVLTDAEMPIGQSVIGLLRGK
ncbi:hypothetical protein ACFQ5M_04740 [Agrilactobacillus yilanensis]|uniref:Bacterial archaeo-eukaryotic release factor family 6 domain-containing protein n=1 Tax=Agrilactobacillus yilanensis TaxID=2485997 RepID=A0ABW4J4V5_9LACO|nr:hypothetical protein [Agrilactobacillus yilanensis]